MAKFHARNVSLYLDTTAGASTSVTGDLNSIELEMEAEAPEVTSFGDTTVQRLSNGVSDWNMSVEGYYNQGTNAACILYALLAGSTYVQLGINGSTTGSPKLTGSGVVTNVSFSWGIGDAAGFSFEVAARSGSLSSSTW